MGLDQHRTRGASRRDVGRDRPRAARAIARGSVSQPGTQLFGLNARVLALAADPSLPLLERAKFLAIFASNLDEFYMVRVAGLKRRDEMGLSVRSADGLSPREQLAR